MNGLLAILTASLLVSTALALDATNLEQLRNDYQHPTLECDSIPDSSHCDCTDNYNGFHLDCILNSTHDNEPARQFITYTDRKVVIRCTNSPDWTEFFKNWCGYFPYGFPKRLEFIGCNPPSSQALWNPEECSPLKHVQVVKFAQTEEPLTAQGIEPFADKVEWLQLSNVDLTNVDPDFLKGFTKMEMLEIRDSPIVIPKNFFNHTKLQMIEITRSKLKALIPGTFSGLKNLRALNLWNNEITELHPDIFNDLTNLTHIDLQSNRLITLPSGIFRNLKKLDTLSLSLNNISTLPSNLFEFNPMLRNFKLSYNQQNLTLPSGLLANKPMLREVSFLKSNIHNITEDIFWNSTNLVELDLSSNRLKNIPSTLLKDAVKLRLFHLNDNLITELPNFGFIMNGHLEQLGLRNNRIKKIHEFTFIGLQNLTRLRFDGNGLQEIDMNAMVYLNSLEFAEFNNNELSFQTNVSDIFGTVSPFHHCRKLKKVELAFNNITEVMDDWIFGSNQLQKLDLSFNKIARITAQDFQFLSSEDVELDLSNNQITEVDLDLIETIFHETKDKDVSRGSVHVKLHKNPLDASCKAYNLLRYAHNMMPRSVKNNVKINVWDMKFASPSWYNSLSLSNVSPIDFKCLTFELNNARREDPCRVGSPCDCYKRPHDRTLIIDCKERELDWPPLIINTMGMSRVVLDLEGNLLRDAPLPDQYNGYNYVTSLNLARNLLEYVSQDLITDKLQSLDLSKNKLTALDGRTVQALKKPDLQLMLGDNPWKCECNDNTRYILELAHAKRHSIDALYCGEGDDAYLLQETLIHEFCTDYSWYFRLMCTGVGGFGFLVSILIALYCRYKKAIKSWLYYHQYCMCLVTEEELDEDKNYDAFISFSHKDEAFVIEELMAKLEGGPKPYKLCLHNRDWLAGEWIPRQIERSVEESRRTIVVLSRNFLESTWTKFEFQAAHKQAVKEKRNRIIVVVLGELGPLDSLEPELRDYLKMNTYIKWGEPWFWQKLMYAMPHETHMEIQNRKLKRQEKKKARSTEKILKKKLEEVKIVISDEKYKIRKNNSILGQIYSISRDLERKTPSESDLINNSPEKTTGNV